MGKCMTAYTTVAERVKNISLFWVEWQWRTHCLDLTGSEVPTLLNWVTVGIRSFELSGTAESILFCDRGPSIRPFSLADPSTCSVFVSWICLFSVFYENIDSRVPPTGSIDPAHKKEWANRFHSGKKERANRFHSGKKERANRFHSGRKERVNKPHSQKKSWSSLTWGNSWNTLSE
jgi:hypothetical protein